MTVIVVIAVVVVVEAACLVGTPSPKLRRYVFFGSRFHYGTEFFPCPVPLEKNDTKKYLYIVPLRTKRYRMENISEFRDIPGYALL